MHFYCEIVIPPTDDIEGSVESVMQPFNEQPDSETEDDYCNTRNGFWDWYVIGGRFAGNKLMQSLDQNKLDSFHEWMSKENVTVHGFTAGKQELPPHNQVYKIDAKWNELFPPTDGVAKPCPIFKHFNNHYVDNGELCVLDKDICTLKEAIDVTCNRVIFANPSWNTETKEYTGPLKAEYMICKSVWNGVNFMNVDWDGSVRAALENYKKKLVHYKEEYCEAITPKDDWLAVTVDYHS